jgi:hypothetical protein
MQAAKAYGLLCGRADSLRRELTIGGYEEEDEEGGGGGSAMGTSLPQSEFVFVGALKYLWLGFVLSLRKQRGTVLARWYVQNELWGSLRTNIRHS